MKLLTLMMAVTVASAAAEVAEEDQLSGGRIINGTPDDASNYPFYGLLERKDRIIVSDVVVMHCGVSLISAKFFLTAGHCFLKYRDPKSFVILMGVTNRCDGKRDFKIIDVSNIIVHPKTHFGSQVLKNDIALIQVEKELTGITPIQLPDEKVYPGELGAIIGFGLQHIEKDTVRIEDLSCTLMKSDQMVQHPEECVLKDNSLVDGTFCTVGVTDKLSTACRGDSGGPWIHIKDVGGKRVPVIVGISSFGDKLCDASQNKDYYTDVFTFLPWIMSELK